jgi:hypothetical protein
MRKSVLFASIAVALSGCGSDDTDNESNKTPPVSAVTPGIYYSAQPLSLNEFTTLSIASADELKAFSLTLPDVGEAREVTTVVDILNPTPHTEFWYQDQSLVVGQLMDEQAIHERVHAGAEAGAVQFYNGDYRTPYLEHDSFVAESVFVKTDEAGKTGPISQDDEEIHFYVASPEYVNDDKSPHITGLQYPIEFRIGVFEGTHNQFCDDTDDSVQCNQDAPHQNYNCGLVPGTGSLGACEGVNPVEPDANIIAPDYLPAVNVWPIAEVENIAILKATGSQGLNPTWEVVNFPELAQFHLSSSNSSEVNFYADTAGAYEITLTVINQLGKPDTATTTIQVVNDADGDGIIDENDDDPDGDGYVGDDDLFPMDKASHADSDGDGISNYHQADEDGDGVDDIDDAFPFDPTRTEYDVYTEPAHEMHSNDGIAFAEQTELSGPLLLDGELLGDVGYDQDYYAVEMRAGRATFNLDMDSAYTPTLSAVDADGNLLPNVVLTDQNTSYAASLSVVIPQDGIYYFVVSSVVDETRPYRASIIYDADQDGVSDSLEQALDSNWNNSDSDGDQISDFIEIELMRIGYHDVDGDGIPAWWDLESDGDQISDTIELKAAFLFDADGDGIVNSADIDSDNNGVIDAIEAGNSPMYPVDTDQDGNADPYDMDNDGDLIPDTEDPDMLTFNERQADPIIDRGSFGIISLHYEDDPSQNACATGTYAVAEVVNIPGNNLRLIHESSNGVRTIEYERDGDFLRFECSDYMLGRNNIAAISGSQISANYALDVVDNRRIFVYEAYESNGRLYMEGRNFDQPYTVHFPSNDVSIDNNKYSTDTHDYIDIPSDYAGGSIYVSTPYGNSQTFSIDYIGNYLNVSVQPPAFVDMGELQVSDSGTSFSWVGEDGEIRLETSLYQPQKLDFFIEDDGSYQWVASGIAFPWMDELNVNATTLALSLLFQSINQDWTSADAVDVYQQLIELPELQDLGDFLYRQLEKDGEYLTKFDVYTTAEYRNAYEAINMLNASVNAASTIDFEPGEIDDIKVYGKNGIVTVENDTKLFLSAQATNAQGQVINEVRYATSLYDKDLLSPQSSNLHIATPSPLDLELQSALVRIITPGEDTSHTPEILRDLNTSEAKARDIATIRTVISNFAVPLIVSTVDMAQLEIAPKVVENIITTHGDFIITEALELAAGQQDMGMFVNNLIVQFRNDIIDGGPLSDALVGAILNGTTAEVKAKIMARLASKAIPVLGQVMLAWQAGENFFLTGINVGKTLSDLHTVDAAIDFEYESGYELHDIVPGTVAPISRPQTAHLSGVGMQTHEGSIFSNSTRAQLRLFESGTDNEVFRYYVSRVSNAGAEAEAYLPGKLFTTDGVTYDADFIFDFGGNIVASNRLSNAVVVSSELVLESLSKTGAHANESLLLTGSGFSLSPNENEVYIGDIQVPVTRASRSVLQFSIPPSMDLGTYDVKVRRTLGNDEFSDYSNSLPLTIGEAETVIRVCDDGSAKDDNFALNVNDIRVGQTNTSRYNYCFDFPVSVQEGWNRAILTGLDAPDGIGTYRILFPSGVEVRGDKISGDDLVPGSPPKFYEFFIVGGKVQSIILPSISTSALSNKKG